jgi:Response regulator of the LytR/AlgR family
VNTELTKIRTLLVEDEEPARAIIKEYLKTFLQVEIIGEAGDGFSGAKAINDLKPDLIFLDIQMPKLTGFELLELLDHQCLIIFTTAYDQYAIKAFEMNAVDYLLKPFSITRFNEAVERAITRFHTAKHDIKTAQALIKSAEDSIEYLERIAVRKAGNIEVIPVKEIIYFEADGDYVILHTANGKFMKEKTMKFFEEHLPISAFVRIHRSFIVNVEKIQRLELYEKDSYMVALKNGEKLRSSDAGQKLLRQRLNL